MKRCAWPNIDKSELYKSYHDKEWGVASHSSHHLFEMLVLESFHCGLSWLIILKKRQNFRKAFDNFNPLIMATYNEEKIKSLLNDKSIIRNKGKILAAVGDAKAFLETEKEFGSFSNYIWHFTNDEVIYIPNKYSKDGVFLTTNELSDRVSADLKKRGFKYMGSVTTFSYLEAIGVMNNHSYECDLCKVKKNN